MPKLIKTHDHDPELWLNVLVEIIRECQDAQGLAFGQMIYNAIYDRDKPKNAIYYDMDFHDRLFNMKDEELILALKNFLEE